MPPLARQIGEPGAVHDMEQQATVVACVVRGGVDGGFQLGDGGDGVVGGGDDIDCATLAGNGSCDEACNTGACNNDGGDCD